jgi:hypothetical protein
MSQIEWSQGFPSSEDPDITPTEKETFLPPYPKPLDTEHYMIFLA